MNNFRENLKALRKRDGLTQSEFAAQIDIPRPNIASWEEGRGHPNYDTLIRIADFFGVTLDQLIR